MPKGAYIRTQYHLDILAKNRLKQVGGWKHSEESKKKIGSANSRKIEFNCDYCGSKASVSPSSFKPRKRHFCSRTCYWEWMEKHWPQEEHPRWRGGITPITQAERGSNRYFKWRRLVFERDGYKCVWCGSKERIEGDHIKAWAKFPELRFEVSNGRTLCYECHLSIRRVR